MEKFKLIQCGNAFYMDSREIADMVDKRHSNLTRDIRNYITAISTNSNLSSLDFFRESVYEDGKGEKRTYYLITKKGCELIAHKLTGERGVQFSATYITQFHEMERQISGGLENALLKGLEEIRELKAQMMRQQRLITGKAKTEELPDSNFLSIREYGDIIGAILPKDINGWAQRASSYSRKHGVKTYKKRYNGSAAVAFHIDVLKWLFGMVGGDCHD